MILKITLSKWHLMLLLIWFGLYSVNGQNPVSSIQNGVVVPYPATPHVGQMLRWSDPGTWNTGMVPGPGDEVTIPLESAVVIDCDIEVQAIRVHGQLVVLPELESVSIETEYMLISGELSLFEWGTEDEPWVGKGVLTLNGDSPAIIPGVTSFPPENSKGIMVMSNGMLHVHGVEKTSWTVLDRTANVGEGQIEVEGIVSGWNPGDEIVIASSAPYIFDLQNFWGDDGHLEQAERVNVVSTQVVNGNTIIEINPPLQFSHYGEIQTYTSGSQSWDLDERTEVGVLTRNIKIQGDESSETTHHGGHIMIMYSAFGYVSGVELFRMGQQEFKARYPFHWHMAKDVSGQYLMNSSLHDLYFRAVTVHGTQNSTVNDNVVFETQGHAMFFEDAVESGNVMNNNLVMNVRRPPLGIGASSFIGSDRGEAHIRARGPGAFWITNPQNTFEGNHVAGIQGMGFWYGMPKDPTGPSANDPAYSSLQPSRLPLTKFHNNTAHGAMTGFHQDHANDDNSTTGFNGGHYFLNNLSWQTVTNFTAYHCYRGWWTLTVDKGIEFHNTILADCVGKGMTVTSFKGRTYNSLFVGHSANNPLGGSTHFTNSAISLYDGYMAAYDSHFADFNYTHQGVFELIGGRENRTNNIFKGCTFTPNSKLYDPEIIEPMSVRLMSVAHDVDGVLTQPWGAVCVYHPFMVDQTNFTSYLNAKSYTTDYHFAALNVFYNYQLYTIGGANTNPDAGNQYMEWGDGHCIHTDERLQDKAQYGVVPNLGRVYKLRLLEGIPDPLDIHLNYAMNGDVIDFQILDSPTNLTISTSGYSSKSSEAAVWTSSTNAYHWNATTKTLSVRMIAANAAGTTPELKMTATAKVQINGGNLAPLNSRDSRPFGGTHRTPDTKVEAEWFDYGGQDVAYYKTLPPEMIYFFTQFPDPNDQPENLRSLSYGRKGELLRLYPIATGEFAVKDIDDREYIRYTFQSANTFTADFNLEYALVNAGEIEVFVNGVSAWGAPVSLAASGGATTFTNVILQPITLQPGINVVEIRSHCDDLSIDWFSIGDPNVVSAPAPICKASPTTSIAEEVDLGLSVYPNPSDGIVNIHFDAQAEESLLQVADLQGRVLMNEWIDSDVQLNTQNFVTGTYIITLTNPNGEQQREILLIK
ncbi:MAG: T9SS type A sorting domain-containing protein [Bacteroidetes bacterium]|nr:MAG: T9SS type A sorting domain-containing protein [Bacteroidota bacterium]